MDAVIWKLDKSTPGRKTGRGKAKQRAERSLPEAVAFLQTFFHGGDDDDHHHHHHHHHRHGDGIDDHSHY